MVEKGGNPGRDHDRARREAADLVVLRHVADAVERRVERPGQQARRRPDVQADRLAPAPGVSDELVVGGRAPLDERAARRRLDREDRRGIGHPEAGDGCGRPELGAGDAGPRPARRKVAHPLLGNLGELLVQARPGVGEGRGRGRLGQDQGAQDSDADECQARTQGEAGGVAHVADPVPEPRPLLVRDVEADQEQERRDRVDDQSAYWSWTVSAMLARSSEPGRTTAATGRRWA